MNFKSALVVDDSRFMRKIIGDSLKDIGINKIFFAENSAEAKQQFLEHHPDFVTLDLVMPGENGIACLEEILAIDQDAVVFMLSTLSNQQLIDEAISKGAKGYLKKPLNSNSLLQAISSIVVT